MAKQKSGACQKSVDYQLCGMLLIIELINLFGQFINDG